MQEKKPRRRVAVPLDRLVGRSRDQLSDIARKLEQAVFPISDARGQHFAHAIAAIRLGQGLLRDVPANPGADRTRHLVTGTVEPFVGQSELTKQGQ